MNLPQYLYWKLTCIGNSFLWASQTTLKVRGRPWNEAPCGRIDREAVCSSSTLMMYRSAMSRTRSMFSRFADLLSKQHKHEGRRCQLHSANSGTSFIRRTYSSYGDRCFAAANQKLCNSLPAHPRQTDIHYKQFKRLLKTFLLGCWDHGPLRLTVKLRHSSCLTYLLTLLSSAHHSYTKHAQ